MDNSRWSRVWLATSRRYSVDESDAHVLETEDQVEEFQKHGWDVAGPFVLESEANGRD